MKVPLLDLTEQNQALRPEIEAALGRVLDTNAFILGGEVKALEEEVADYCRTKYAIGCASGPLGADESPPRYTTSPK